tara:strand:- start:565 stop:1248 length:684 start_codon:yes stop_codon:yes gene_type:complete
VFQPRIAFPFSLKQDKATALGNAFLGSDETQNDAQWTPSAMIFFRWALCIFTRMWHTLASVARMSSPQQPIPGLPEDVVVTHILSPEYFDDPADLARLPAVSHAMRDAVAATGLQFEELDENDATQLGCLSALQRRHRQGRLRLREHLCEAAARSGHLEVLQWLHANGCPWNKWTCAAAVAYGHVKVLQWASGNECPCDEAETVFRAAFNGHLNILIWACVKGCPWD